MFEFNKPPPAALHVDCPRCEAPRGRKCYSFDVLYGWVRDRSAGYHVERINAIRACTEDIRLTEITATQ